MAGGSRTLKLSILGDVDNLNKSLAAGSKDVDTFGDKMTKTGKMVGAAFVAAAAAAGAYAVKIGVDGVKAALEDEKSQRILALTLQKTTGATTDQIAAIEGYITKTALATGVTDDELRPALSRLTRSTKDVEESQKLLSLAMDISSATGKPLELIANSLGKAYDGNANALGKLGLGIDQSILKTKDFNLVYESLRGSFAGFAANEANTFQGKMARLTVAFDEAKESIGYALLPILSTLMKFVTDSIMPAINKLTDSFSMNGDGLGKTINDVATVVKDIATPIFTAMQGLFGKIKKVIDDNKESFTEFWEIVKWLAPKIGAVIGAAVEVIGTVVSTVISLIGKIMGAVKPVLNFVIDSINTIISGINIISPFKDIPKLDKIGSTPIYTSGGAASMGGATATGNAAAAGAATIQAAIASGATSTAGASKAGSTATTNPFAGLGVSGGGSVVSSDYAQRNAGVVNINIGMAGNPEGTARAIVEALNDSFYRGTGGAGALQMA
jgi:hypothetical protein